MALTTDQIQAQIDAIDQALAAPQEARVADRSVTQRPVKDLLAAREALVAQLNASSQSSQVRQYRAYTTDGWGC